VDSRDFSFTPRAFEQVLGLADGTLAGKQVTANRSLTWAEAEVVRRFNRQFKAAGLPPRLHLTLMHRAGDHVKKRTPAPDEQKIATPEWAVRRANEVGAEMTRAIEATGARIIGDLSLLSSAPVRSADTVPPAAVPVEIASRFAAGFALAADDVSRQATEDVREAHARARAALQAARTTDAAQNGHPRPTPSIPRRAAARARRSLRRARQRSRRAD
jgi:hypothetical protein